MASRTVVSLVMLDGTDRATNLMRESQDSLNANAVRTNGRRKRTSNKDNNSMATTTVNPTPAKTYSPITKTVFDLNIFDDVKLVKDFVPPTEATDLQSALEIVGNDQTKLLSLINKGLELEARAAQYDDMSGFKVVGEDGNAGEVYTGRSADESQGKLINLGILSMAKVMAGGAWDSKSKDEKKALKEKAAEFIRSNPAMLASFAPAQG